MERREPIIEEEQPEEEPPPETASDGGVRPPGRIGGGLRDDEGGDEPPRRRGESYWSDPEVCIMPVEALNLSARSYNCLRRSGLMTVGQVITSSVDELLSIRNFGRRQYQELRERLDELGVLETGALLPQARPEPPNLKELLRRWKESLDD